MLPVFRFAPSPNGLLHLGHARSALLNWDCAQRTGGRFLLRIEDIDQARCRPEWIEAMLEDLAWLGLRWEEPRRQSRHFADYQAALDRLDGLLYRSTATRAEIAARSAPSGPLDPDGAPLLTRTLLARLGDAGGRAALRLDMAAAQACLARQTRQAPLAWLETPACGSPGTLVAARPERWGDAVLRRKDVPASYHIAVVVDDALQGITDVVRGEDLREATHLHRLLQALLGLPSPRYHHHALLLDDAGAKLSKSLGSKSLQAWRQEGATPADIRSMAGLPVSGG